MSVGNWLAKAAGGTAAAAVTAITVGVAVERRVARTRDRTGARLTQMTSLRSLPRAVHTTDGIELYAEVDEVSPYEGKGRREEPGVTLVFSHGYALNLDCWYFQRDAFRGKYRMVFYDQRSHGRSEMSPRPEASIDRLGDDLAEVIGQLSPDGTVVLVGHSMGGMAIMAFAERHPEVFAARIAGVALIATTAGDLKPHQILSRMIPNRVGEFMAPRLVAALASAPELVDSSRKRGSNIGFLVAERFAFGGDPPPAEVEFLNSMLDGTSMKVIGAFFPVFSAHDKFEFLALIDKVPTTIIGAGRDRITDVSHSRRMAEVMPGARYVEVPEAGHMVIFEARDLVNAEIDALVDRAR